MFLYNRTAFNFHLIIPYYYSAQHFYGFPVTNHKNQLFLIFLKHSKKIKPKDVLNVVTCSVHFLVYLEKNGHEKKKKLILQYIILNVYFLY